MDLGQNLETEPPGLDFRYTVGKDGRGPCEEVVGRCVQGGNGGRVAGSRNEREAVGLGQNIETEPPGLDFGHTIGKDGRGLGSPFHIETQVKRTMSFKLNHHLKTCN